MKKFLVIAVLTLMACAGQQKQSQETEIKKDVKEVAKSEAKMDAKKKTKKESGLKEQASKQPQKKSLTLAEKCNKINETYELQEEAMAALIEELHAEQENVHEDCSCIEIITCDGLDICYTFNCSKSGIIEAFK